DAVWVTGNTVIDAVKQMAKDSQQSTMPRMLMTAHRRENFGQPITEILQGVRNAALSFPNLQIVYPVHPNPNVQKPALQLLGGISNIELCDPLGYQAFVSQMQQSWFIVSDSGGVQEEATALGRPVLLLRSETERPEGLQVGNVQKIELSAVKVEQAITQMLKDKNLRQSMSHISDVFGDGHASRRIVQASLIFLQGRVDG
ncbi:MAG: UDP-N-acetylglucosamine 2-epimerase, partial [Mariprofundaceae bacterium]